MANVKNFGLIGVGSELQFGKASSKLINNAGNFNFRAADGTTPVAISTAGITSSAGGVTLTTGNVTLSSTAGTISIGGDVTLQRQGAGVLQQTGTGAFMLPVGNDTQRDSLTPATGMIRVNNESSPVVEFYDGTQWTDLGGSAAIAALQTEVDNIETSLGAGVNSNGTFNANGFTDYTGVLVDPTSFTDAINQIALAVSEGDTLEEIIAPVATGNIIYANSNTTWAVGAPGATTGVQAYDAGLSALAAKSDTGILVQSGADSYVSRSLEAPAAGITISNADGVSGNPTFALANDLAGVEGLSTTGLAVRTGDGTWTTTEITGVSGRIVVTDGTGVAGDPTIDLATVTNPGNGGTFVKVTTDAYGRVTNSTAVVTSDITALVDNTYVNLSGDTMDSGADLTFTGGGEVLGLPAVPSGPTAAASKAYVDAVAEGLTIKPAVETVVVDTSAIGVETTNWTYNNGSSGVGATITRVGNGAFPTIDGVTISTTTMGQNGVLIALNGGTGNLVNGRYNLTQVGDGSNPWILTRCGLCDESDEIAGAYTFVKQGTTYAGSGWVQSWFGGGTGTIGTTAIVVDQFSGAGSYLAGTGLTLTGNTFSVNLGAGIGEFAANNVGIDLYNTTTGAIILTEDGTTRSSGNASKLHLLLPAGSGLTQDATGLYVGAGQITNAMLDNSSFSATADSGSVTLDLGDVLHIRGVSTQGTSVSVNETVPGTVEYVVTAADASSSQKGVASFTTSEFTVTSGNVALGLVPVTKGGTGLSTAAVGDLLVGNGTNSYGALAIGTTGQYLRSNGTTAAWAALSASDITGTLGVANGGTGATTFTDTAILIGDGTNPIEATSALTYNSGTDVLTIGGATGVSVTAAGGDVTIASLDTNADIILNPNGTGQVVIGPAGDGVISADSGQTLTIVGNDTLVLQSTSGDIVMTVPSGTGTKVTVSGPTAADYATSLANEDLVNKYYVDQAIQSGAASGSVKVVKATVSLASAGSTNIGAALPAGASILRVKVQVTAADTGSGTLQVGKSGGSEYMTTSENDTQTIGLYLAETYVVEAGSVQVQATVAGTPAGSGSAVVIVEYQVA